MSEKTATQTIMSDQDALDQRILHNYMEAFWKRWAPADRCEAAEFQADLHNIVRQVYRDAQEPLLKQLTVISETFSTFPLITPTAKK